MAPEEYLRTSFEVDAEYVNPAARKAHRTDVVDGLSNYLGRTLPQPDYAATGLAHHTA